MRLNFESYVIESELYTCIHCCMKTFPDSKWKLGQHWVLSCNFRWANVGLAMQNHPHFAHPKNVGPTCYTNVGPTCCTNVGPTCCTNVGPTCCTNVGPTCCINVGPTCWANVGSLLASGSCLQCFFLFFISQLFTCYSPCDLSVFLDRQSLKYNLDSKKSSKWL